MLDFWATWCSPCLELHGRVVHWLSKYEHAGVRGYGIVYRDEPRRVLEWLERHEGLGYEQLFDHGDVARAYGVHAIPQMFLIDRHGRLLGHCWGCADFEEYFGHVLDSIVSAESIKASLDVQGRLRNADGPGSDRHGSNRAGTARMLLTYHP
ncbi:MAG: TlpA family protein disulfide reductase [Gemmatimonadales bacterium]